MTTTDLAPTVPSPLHTLPVRLDVSAVAPQFEQAVSALDDASVAELDRVDFDRRLRELVRLRASQLNGCAYCVDQHSRDARKAREHDQRIAAVAVWRESPFFTLRERAALRFTEAVTLVTSTHVPDEEYAAVAELFDEAEVAALLALIVTINAWNMLSATARCWTPRLRG